MHKPLLTFSQPLRTSVSSSTSTKSVSNKAFPSRGTTSLWPSSHVPTARILSPAKPSSSTSPRSALCASQTSSTSLKRSPAVLAVLRPPAASPRPLRSRLRPLASARLPPKTTKTSRLPPARLSRVLPSPNVRRRWLRCLRRCRLSVRRPRRRPRPLE